MNEEMNDPIWGEGNKVKAEYKTLAWGKPGDYFKGVLTDNGSKEVKSKYPPFEMQKIFEFKAIGGAFHNIVNKVVDVEPTECIAGDFWSVIPKAAMLAQLKKAKIGQIVGLRFTEEKKSKTEGYNDAKIVNVFLGEMDPTYQGESGADSR